MMNVTITGQTGPGITATSQPILDVRQFMVDMERDILQLIYGDSHKVAIFQYSNIATLTWSISAGTTTIAAST